MGESRDRGAPRLCRGGPNVGGLGGRPEPPISVNPMFQYALRRLLLAVPMLLGAMSIVFFAMRVLPGDPCVAMMGDQATTEALADCTRNLGLRSEEHTSE